MEENIFSAYPKMNYHSRVYMALAQKKYAQILEFFESEEGHNISVKDKEAINQVFDVYLGFLESSGIKLESENLRILCAIKKILIIYDLEISGNPRDVEELKQLVLKHIQNDKPLRDLIRRPLVSSIKGSGKVLNFFTDEIINTYREVLGGLNKEDAVRLHARQLQFFLESDNVDILNNFALQELKEIILN